MSWEIQQINQPNGNTPNGPATVGQPYVSVYNGQQHIGYRDSSGTIWDSFYRPDLNKWELQQIKGAQGNTRGNPAISGPFIGIYNEQQHFAYIDAEGRIWDSWYDGSGHWNLQQINGPDGNTVGPPAAAGAHGPVESAGLPATWANSVSIPSDFTNTQQHFTYVGVHDLALYDAFWDSNNNSWHLQKLTLDGNTSGPVSVSSPFGSFAFHHQQHFGYEGIHGDIWDANYDGNGHWSLQKINNGGNTEGSAASGGTCPFIWVDSSNTQQHFTYQGADLAIYDAFWDSNSNSWHLQKVTLGGNTSGPPEDSPPFVALYELEQHIGYIDDAQNVWDSIYDGDGHWSLVKINNGGSTLAAPASPKFGLSIWPWGNAEWGQLHFTYADQTGTIWDVFWNRALIDNPT
jgi:hypothetical protein